MLEQMELEQPVLGIIQSGIDLPAEDRGLNELHLPRYVIGVYPSMADAAV